MLKMQHVLRSIICAAALLFAHAAAAVPITYDFIVTGADGPLAGVVAPGFFSYDSSIIPAGGGRLNGTNLLTQLGFTWDGIVYNAGNANTGSLIFDAAGNLTLALFGTECNAGSCAVRTGIKGWDVNTLFNNFSYATTTAPGIFSGVIQTTLRVAAVPEPVGFALFGIGLLIMGVVRKKAGQVRL